MKTNKLESTIYYEVSLQGQYTIFVDKQSKKAVHNLLKKGLVKEVKKHHGLITLELKKEKGGNQ